MNFKSSKFRLILSYDCLFYSFISSNSFLFDVIYSFTTLKQFQILQTRERMWSACPLYIQIIIQLQIIQIIIMSILKTSIVCLCISFRLQLFWTFGQPWVLLLLIVLIDYNIVIFKKGGMNSELDWQRIIEWSHSEATYLLRVVVTPELLELQLEDKYSGQIWQSAYSNLAIEQLTQKAKNKKKYSIFVNMLRSALERTKQNLFIQILSYREITIKTMKNGKASSNIPPEQAAKRFLILNYNIDFEKIQFPISIKYFNEAPPQRLKLTIKRLSQQLNNFRGERSESDLERENAYLKYELESLKSKQKTNGKLQNSIIYQPKLQQLQKDINQKAALIEKLNIKLSDLQKNKLALEEKVKQSEETIKQLILQLKEKQQNSQKSNHDKYYQQKLEVLIKKMQKLSQQLIYAHQKQKKSEIKIQTLQKQLQNMQKNQSRTAIRYKQDRLNEISPQSKSEQKQMSIKSGKSNKSGNSKKNFNLNKNSKNSSNINYKKYSNKKSSVYDSDTQSSRMRRLNNGRNSPFRQGTSNVVKKNTKINHERSRSRSKDKMTSPNPSKIIQSQMYSQTFQSDDSEERFQRLQKQMVKNVKQKPQSSIRKAGSRVSSGSNQGNMLENRLQTLQQMIRKAAQSTKKK